MLPATAPRRWSPTNSLKFGCSQTKTTWASLGRTIKPAQLACGPYLFFLNNDTLLAPGTLGKLTDYLDAHPETVLAGPRLRDGAGRTQMSQRRRPTIATFLHRTLLLRWTGLFRGQYKAYRRATQGTEDLAQPVEVLMGAALLLRREDFWRIGGWDEDFIFGGEDMELCHRASRRGKVIYLPQVEITHFGAQHARKRRLRVHRNRRRFRAILPQNRNWRARHVCLQARGDTGRAGAAILQELSVCCPSFIRSA